MALSSYTSKISEFCDLESLETYGFRGEALHALCHVADVSIITKTHSDEAAMSYTINHDGNIVNTELSHRSTGTTVKVKQLFKNFPVRRQAICSTRKSNQDVKLVEFLLKCYGICQPGVRINYRVNNNTIFMKPSLSNSKEALQHILGKKVVSNLELLEIKNPEVKIELMLPKSDINDLSQICQMGQQYIFVNNRPVKYKELEKVMGDKISEHFEDKIPPKKKPIFFLSITVPPSELDVNLEPNKTAVLLKNQKDILQNLSDIIIKYYCLPPFLENTEEGSVHDQSTGYSDYTQSTKEREQEKEWPACKRRRIEPDKTMVVDNCPGKVGDDSSNPEIQRTKSNNKNVQCNNAKSGDNVTRLAELNLSEPDSNDDEHFRAFKIKSNISFELKDLQVDSEPFEFHPDKKKFLDNGNEDETLSQLPIVDLGDDFDIEEIINETTSNDRADNNQPLTDIINKMDNVRPAQKDIFLEMWSKGQVLGITGGTNVKNYNNISSKSPSSNSQSLNDSISDSSSSRGFIKFSREIRPQIIRENPEITLSDVAKLLSKRWKELSPEERGYYRDLAVDEKKRQDAEKAEKKEKHDIKESVKNKKRLMQMFEKMKTLKPEAKKGDMMIRTAVPWDMNINKVSKSFCNQKEYKNSSSIVGPLNSNIWAVRLGTQIWALNTLKLKQNLNLSPSDNPELNAELLEKLLKRWLTEREDMSIMHPIYEFK
ncbi:PMS1 protein homolog 1 isoform X2 [Cephus cinctus]|nr:PMS1 protein homolog 1 isoform X2 [Cephus cinctus]